MLRAAAPAGAALGAQHERHLEQLPAGHEVRLGGAVDQLAPTAAQTVVNVTSTSVPSSHAAATASPDLAAIVGRAMAKEIDKRHQSAASFSAELRSVGAMLDVRSGDAAPGDLLPLDDEGGSGNWWWAAAAIVVGAAVVWWAVK